MLFCCCDAACSVDVVCLNQQMLPPYNPCLQVLVYHDLLGMLQHPHHAKVTPKFCKQYAKVGQAIQEALAAFQTEVSERQFPSPRYSPYALREGEDVRLVDALRTKGLDLAAAAASGMLRDVKAEAANGAAESEAGTAKTP